MGSLGPGTQGDSCFGTCYTPATAVSTREKSTGTDILQRDSKFWTFFICYWIPHSDHKKEAATEQLKRPPPQHTETLLLADACWLTPGARGALGAVGVLLGLPVVLGYLGGLVLSPTDVAELAATAAPILQLVFMGPLTLLQAELVEGLTADLAIYKLQGGRGRF